MASSTDGLDQGMSDKPVLLYFDLSGRAIYPRIALFAAFGKDGWIDQTMSFEEFGEEKKKLLDGSPDTKLVSGSLPQITLPSGKIFCQSLSIARWACCYAQNNNIDINNLYPTHNADDFIMLDETLTFVSEIFDRMPMETDEETKKNKRQEYSAEGGFLCRAMRIIEKRLGEYPGSFLLGSDVCLADFAIYSLAAVLAKGFFDYIPKELLEAFPRISNVMNDVPKCDWMEKYRAAYGKDA